MKHLIGTSLAIVAFSISGTAIGSKVGQFAVPMATRTTLDRLDQNFVCPKSLPNPAARQADLDAFQKSLTAALPIATDQQIASIRSVLLQKHRCAVA